MDSVRTNLKLKLPKIMTQRRMDESVESNMIKGEKKRRRKVRKVAKDKFKIEVKTSQMPKGSKIYMIADDK